jgi:integrase
MRWGVNEDYIEKSPAKRVGFLPVTDRDRQKRRPFTVDELKRIYLAADEAWRGAILFSYHCALRLGDVAALRWSNISDDGMRLTCTERKTGKMKRLKLEKPLLRWLERQPASDRTDQPLFPSLCVEHSKVGWLSYEFRKILVKAGLLPKFDWKKRAKGKAGPRKLSKASFHALRHTTRTQADSKAKNSTIVDELMGHSAEVGKGYRHYDEDDYSKVLSQLTDFVAEIEEPGLGFEKT